MKAENSKQVVVVGAGVAGLTVADSLARRGWSITVVEREQAVGGLARSFRSPGATFDIGPHRFHTDDQEVGQFILDVLGPNHRTIDRSSAVWLYESYHDWPLTRASLFKLPPLVMARAFVDLFSRPQSRDESLESYVLSRYGATLYEIFFKSYTEKFLQLQCRDLHRDWASAGINRAVIDRRLRFDSLLHVARTTLFPPRIRTQFLYPDSDGIDGFAEALAQRVRQQGGHILTGGPVTALTCRETAVQTVVIPGHPPLPCDLLIWTGSLPSLLELTGRPAPGLGYLAELFFNFVVAGPPALPYQWTYYGGASLSFMRASLPAHFNPRNGTTPLTGICLEVVCQEGDARWQDPTSLRPQLEEDLVRVGLVRQRQDIVGVSVERIREAYPIYTLDYPGRLAQAVEQACTLSNVVLLGRTGTFWYNNMDHSIRQALDCADSLAQGASPRAWNQQLSRSRAL